MIELKEKLMKCTPQQLLQYKAMKKSVILAYVVGAFLGVLGCHKLVTEDYDMFVVYLITFIVGLFMPMAFTITLLLMVVDLLFTWWFVREHNEEILDMILTAEESKE